MGNPLKMKVYSWKKKKNIYINNGFSIAMFDCQRVRPGMMMSMTTAMMIMIPMPIWLTCAKRREFSGMVHWLTINSNPSNPSSKPIQQPYGLSTREWSHYIIFLTIKSQHITSQGTPRAHRRILQVCPQDDHFWMAANSGGNVYRICVISYF